MYIRQSPVLRKFSEKEHVKQFARGLNSEILTYLMASKPKTLERAIDLAEQFEGLMAGRKGQKLDLIANVNSMNNKETTNKNAYR